MSTSHRARNGWVHAQKRGIVSDVLSGIFNPPTLSLSLDIPFTTLLPHSTSSGTTSTSLSQSESISTSLSSSTSSSSATSSSSSVSSTQSSTTTSFSPTSSPIPSSQSIYESTSDGVLVTITSYVDAPTSTTITTSATPAPTTQAFLQNKALSGTVFALVGVVALVAILALATCVVRRKRKNELMREAISFDPVLAERYGAEKEESDRMSTGFGPVNPRSSNGSGHGYSGPVDGTPPTTMMTSPSYPFGPGYGYGYTDSSVKGLQRPERVMTPPGQARFGIATGGNNYTSQGINWTPDVTPFMPTLAEDTHPTGDDAHRA